MTLQDIEHLSSMFGIVQQQLRDYIVLFEDVFQNVTFTLTSLSYVEPATEGSRNISFQHLHENLICFV